MLQVTCYMLYVLFTLLLLRPALDIGRDIVLFKMGGQAVNLTAFLALTVFLTGLTVIISGRQYLKQTPLRYLFPLFILYALLGTLYSFDRTNTIIETLKLIDLAILFGAGFIMVKKHSANISRLLPSGALLGAVVPILIALYQWITISGVTIDQTANRLYATFAHPNILAIFCLVILAVSARQYEQQKNVNQSYALAILILLFVIVGTYSRGVWLILFLYGALQIYLRYRAWFFKLLAGGILLLALMGGVYFALPARYQDSVKTIPIIRRLVYRPANADSITWRLWVARDSLRIFSRRPILGFGYGTFPTVWDTYKDPARRNDPSNEAHNDYIRMLIEGGAVGLTLYLLIFATLLKNAYRAAAKTKWQTNIFLLTLILYCVLAASENLLHHTAPAWWLWFLWGAWSAE